MKKKRSALSTAGTGIFTIVGIVYILPILIVLMNSFKKKVYINKQPFQLPDGKTMAGLENYMTAIDKYNLPIDQIYIKEDGNALLISDKITVDLYNKKDIDIKISELAGMLKKVKGKSGTIDMKYFSEDHKIAVFQPKKS